MKYSANLSEVATKMKSRKEKSTKSKMKMLLCILIISCIMAILLLFILIQKKAMAINDIQEENKSLLIELEDSNKKVTDLKEELEDYKTNIKNKKVDKQSTEKEKTQLNNLLLDVKRKFEGIDADVKKVREQLKAKQTNLTVLEEDNQKLSKLIEGGKEPEKLIASLKMQRDVLKLELQKLKENPEESGNISLGTSILLTESRYNILKKWINDDINLTFELIYGATKLELNKDIFNAKCSVPNIKNTLILIESTNGDLIGGFTNSNWDFSGQKEDKYAFIFDLNAQKKYVVNSIEEAIFNSDDLIFAFGKNDIAVNVNGDCIVKFPITYGVGNEGNLANIKDNLEIKLIEVFHIIPK